MAKRSVLLRIGGGRGWSALRSVKKGHPVSRNVFSAPIGSPFREDRERPRARTRGRVLVTGDNIPSHHFRPTAYHFFPISLSLFLSFLSLSAPFTPPFYSSRRILDGEDPGLHGIDHHGYLIRKNRRFLSFFQLTLATIDSFRLRES